MASTVPQRREAFFNGNANTSTHSPSKSTVHSSDYKAQWNGEKYAGSTKEFTRPQSPSGNIGNLPSSTKKSGPVSNVKELYGTVGFANLPNQVFRNAVKNGFEFTMMIVGQSGLGKTTFLDSLFMTDLSNSKTVRTPQIPPGGKTSHISERTVRLVENGVALTLTLVDTPGFGDAVDNSRCLDPIIQYVDKKFSDYFMEETKIERKCRIPDHRVHCCLYFIAPNGHGLMPLDIEFMKRLHDRVNIVPVIAKADAMMPDECAAFKKMIAKEIAENKIQTYEIPDPDDSEHAKEYRMFKSRVPFAVIGSNLICELPGGKKTRCRKYPWGVVEVENLEHNDFIALRNMIIRTHIVDLIDVTRCVHYENFRYRQLVASSNIDTTLLNKDPLSQVDELKRESEIHMKQEDAKREQIFQEKLTEKQDKLKQAEREVDRNVEQMKKSLEQKRMELEEKHSQFLKNRLAFKQQYPEYQKYISSSSLTDSSSGDSKTGKKWSTGTLSSVFRGHHKHSDQ